MRFLTHSFLIMLAALAVITISPNRASAQTLDQQVEACQTGLISSVDDKIIEQKSAIISDGETLNDDTNSMLDNAALEDSVTPLEEIAEEIEFDQKHPSEDLAIIDGFKTGFGAIINVMETVLFYEMFPHTIGYPEVTEDCEVVQRGFPFVVFWLILGGVFFTLRLAFINLRLFGHGIAVVTNKFTKPTDIGEVTPFQSLAAAVSGTVGLGNIAGVAVAITMGGPGAVLWMMVAGFLGMSTKFAEVTLGHKYRKVDENGKISGGAFYYLRDGLSEIGMAGIGKVLAVLFAALCLCGAFGGGNMFQANQMVAALTDTFDLSDLDWVIALVMAIAVGIVLIGGVKRIASVAEAIVPLMAFVYMASGMVVLVVNAAELPAAFGTIFDSAFSFESAAGGIFGAMIMGFRRAAFSNEAGVGSAPIVMAATKSSEPVQVGSVAILEPFIDTMVICLMTGLVITVTGVYQEGAADGVILTSQSFATVIEWFPIVLSIAVSLFAFSTMLTWSYYGERAWNYLFGEGKVRLYHVLFCMAVFFGGAMQDENNEGFTLIVNFSDLSLLAMSIPNLIGMYLLSGVLLKEVKDYRRRFKAGEIEVMK